jgi:hypothetical protein
MTRWSAITGPAAAAPRSPTARAPRLRRKQPQPARTPRAGTLLGDARLCGCLCGTLRAFLACTDTGTPASGSARRSNAATAAAGFAAANDLGRGDHRVRREWKAAPEIGAACAPGRNHVGRSGCASAGDGGPEHKTLLDASHHPHRAAPVASHTGGPSALLVVPRSRELYTGRIVLYSPGWTRTNNPPVNRATVASAIACRSGATAPLLPLQIQGCSLGPVPTPVPTALWPASRRA